MDEKRQEVFRVANELFDKGPSWVTFFREVLGVDGIVRKLYTDHAALAEFERSPDYQQIQQMLAKLLGKPEDLSAESKEPTRVITVRLPKSVHEALRVEAHDRHTSMNKLCISKLLQVIDDSFVTEEVGSAAG